MGSEAAVWGTNFVSIDEHIWVNFYLSSTSANEFSIEVLSILNKKQNFKLIKYHSGNSSLILFEKNNLLNAINNY